MKNPWFRMYNEFATDPKVQILSEVFQRRYVVLLCLHNNGAYEGRSKEEVALAMRITVDEWIYTREMLVKQGLLKPESFKLNGWENRQFVSDVKDRTAAERQRRKRMADKNLSRSLNRDKNRDVTETVTVDVENNNYENQELNTVERDTTVTVTPVANTHKTLLKSALELEIEAMEECNEYRWMGRIIALSEFHYENFRKMAKGLTLDTILQEEDDYLATLEEGARNRKNWFMYLRAKIKTAAERRAKLSALGL